MLFLLNDVILRLDASHLAPPLAAEQFRALSFNFVDRLGRELFAEQALMQYSMPRRASRLAALIMAKEPMVNAALFVAPTFQCPPDQVQSRYAQVSFEIMGNLWERQRSGKLTNIIADRQVWRRLAA
ncbi:MAG: hypothetical protein U1E50_07735 [Caulobacteraceae bacterium]